jgi:hypothetical protein
VTLKAALVAVGRFEAEAVNVYPLPAALIVRLLNVATPALAPTVRVPERPPPPGFAPSDTTIFLTNVGSADPLPVAAVIVTAGTIATPAFVAPGWTLNTRWEAPAVDPKVLTPVVPPPD